MQMQQLGKEVDFRRSQQSEIRERLNQFCQEKYGITEFCQTAEMLGEVDSLAVCLSRQVPTINVEHTALEFFAEWLTKNGLSTQASCLSFTSDAYSSRNGYKKSLVKIPWIKRGRNGKIHVHHETVLAKRHKPQMEGRILSSMLTADEQKTIPELHSELRQKCLGNGSEDISNFFLTLLTQNIKNGKNKPANVFIRDTGGKREKMIPLSSLNGHAVSRPPADWYYPLYLCLFLDGTRCLVSTVDDCDEVSAWFDKSIQEIRRNTGVDPLIVDIPSKIQLQNEILPGDVNFFHRKVLEEGWQENISMPPADAKLFNAYESFERQILCL